MGKICEDCKFFTKNMNSWNSDEYQRIHAICGHTSVVTRDSGTECSKERSRIFGCGAKARYFEQAQ